MSLLSSTHKLYSRGSPTAEIPDNQLCTVYQCNHVIDVISIQKRSSSISDYRKVSKSLYCDTKSGEVFEYKKHEKRYHSLKDTFTNLRRLINNNFTGRHSELMLVLTYSSYMDNAEQLYQDFRKFWLRFKYHFPPSEYICIIEPQASGSYHLHVLVKTRDGSMLFVPKQQLDQLWGHGGTYVRRITDVDNLGAYFCSYFTNLDYFENTDIQKKYPSAKMIVKNARLHYYPPNLKIYRCSKGIKRPKPITLPFSEVKKIVGDSQPVRQSAKHIVSVDENGTEHELNAIEYRQYNLNIKNKKGV